MVGIKPVPDALGRVNKLEVIPLEELGRPRVDVVVNCSGVFRDLFVNQMNLLDRAVKMAAELDEPEDMNFVRKHARQQVGCPSFFLSLHICLSVFACVCVHMRVYAHLSCTSVCRFVCTSVCTSVCMHVCMFVCVSVRKMWLVLSNLCDLYRLRRWALACGKQPLGSSAMHLVHIPATSTWRWRTPAGAMSSSCRRCTSPANPLHSTVTGLHFC